MEFKINKEKILKGLSKIQGITGKKTNIPITSNVVISTQEAHLSILATDLEIAFQGDYEADILCEGSTAVPSRKFFEIVKDFPSTLVIVKELQNKWIQIADKKVEYKIAGVDTDEFPGIPNVEGVELFNINGDLIRNMIEKTIYAVLSDEQQRHKYDRFGHQDPGFGGFGGFEGGFDISDALRQFMEQGFGFGDIFGGGGGGRRR